MQCKIFKVCTVLPRLQMLAFLFNEGVRWHVDGPVYRRHITIRSGRLNAINGHDRRCNRIGVTPGQWRSAIKVVVRARLAFTREGWCSPRVSYVFILPSIPVIPLQKRPTLAFKISSSWKRCSPVLTNSLSKLVTGIIA